MGCGISSLDLEKASMNQPSKAYRHAIIPPIIDKKMESENGDKGSIDLLHRDNNNNGVLMVIKPLDDEQSMDKGSNGERLKEKSFVERNEEEEKVFEIRGQEKHDRNKYWAKNVEEEHQDRDDNFIYPGSPSFREYCIDSECRDRSLVGDSNDCDSMDCIKDGSDDDLSNRSNKPKNKEYDKKQRKRHGFKNVINKGKTRGRRNLLNFACYNANNVNKSNVEGSFNKIVAKTP